MTTAQRGVTRYCIYTPISILDKLASVKLGLVDIGLTPLIRHWGSFSNKKRTSVLHDEDQGEF